MRVTMRTNAGTTVTINSDRDTENNVVSVMLDNASFEVKVKDTTKAPYLHRPIKEPKY